MEKVVIEAQRREVLGKKVKVLRREGKLPAVIFGHGLETTPIVMDMREASKILSTAGSSTLVTITLDGEEHATLVRERQYEVLQRTLLHVDFQAVALDEKVRASVALILGDEDAPAVKTFGAMIIQGTESIEIECLPQDLPDRIVVDVSSLENIGDSILVQDLPVPEGVEILDDPETMIVVATSLAEEVVEEEEEIEELELEEGVEPEVIGEGEDEEAE
jgi:large subunit ribosomal protein L25